MMPFQPDPHADYLDPTRKDDSTHNGEHVCVTCLEVVDAENECPLVGVNPDLPYCAEHCGCEDCAGLAWSRMHTPGTGTWAA